MPGANGQYTRQTVQERRPQQPKRENGAAQNAAAAPQPPKRENGAAQNAAAAPQPPKRECAAQPAPTKRKEPSQSASACRPKQDVGRREQPAGIDSGDLLLVALLLLLLSEGSAEASPLIMTLALALIL